MLEISPDPILQSPTPDDTSLLQTAGVIASSSRSALGRVASPLNHESTTGRFYFWVPPGTLVEKTQLVVTSSEVGGRSLSYYAVVEEVYRRSRQRSMDGEVDLYDGDLAYEPPFQTDGVTFAEATILRILPPLLTPPLERSDVLLADQTDASEAYGFGEMLAPGPGRWHPHLWDLSRPAEPARRHPGSGGAGHIRSRSRARATAGRTT